MAILRVMSAKMTVPRTMEDMAGGVMKGGAEFACR